MILCSSHGPSTHSTKPLRATPPVAPGSLSNTKGATTLLPKTVPFKARVMPNFKALHSKIPVKTTNTPVADKENSCLPSNIGNLPRRLSAKGTMDKSCHTVYAFLNFLVQFAISLIKNSMQISS